MSVESDSGSTPPPDRYEFASDLPFDAVPHGTALVVRGSPEASPGKLAMRLLAPVSPEHGGALLVETDDTPHGIADRWDEATDVPIARLAVVGCETRQTEPPEGFGAIGCVSQPNDLTGIGIQYSKLARSFTERPHGRLRVGLDSISTLQLYCDSVRTVYRFLHTFTGRIGSSGQLGVFVFNPEMHDPRVTNIVTQPFDAAVDVRITDDGTREARLTGLSGRCSTWTPL